MTAVEWYIENVKSIEIEYLDDKITTTELDVIIDNLGEQAKEMEKQQQGYSEEEVIAFGEFIFKHTLLAHSKGVKNLFEQFKKK
jgi:hypothetical protein